MKKGYQMLLLGLLAGITITLLSGFYSTKSVGQYCSPDPSLNARIDCSLQVKNRGWPLAYAINPDYQPKHGVQPIAAIGDVIFWTIISGLIFWSVTRAKHE